MKTRSVVIIGEGNARVVEHDVPDLGLDDVLVQIRVGGVCRSDTGAFRGESGRGYPAFIGHESAGIVAAVGKRVSRSKVGDNVAVLSSMGTMSQYVVVPEIGVAKLPDQIDNWADWVVEPMMCAVNGVDVAAIRPDDLLGVVGCGFMGQLVIRAARLTPARSIFAFDVSDAALDRARASGADQTLSSRQEPETVVSTTSGLVAQRPKSPSPYTNRNGPLDVVFEASGTSAGLELASRLVRLGGTLVMFGHQHGYVPIDGTRWHLNGIRVLNAAPMIANDIYDVFQRTAGLMSAGRLNLDGLVTHTANFEHAQEAFESFSDPSYVKGSLLFS